MEHKPIYFSLNVQIMESFTLLLTSLLEGVRFNSIFDWRDVELGK